MTFQEGDPNYWMWQIEQDFGTQLAHEMFANYRESESKAEQVHKEETVQETSVQEQLPQEEVAAPQPAPTTQEPTVEKGNYSER